MTLEKAYTILNIYYVEHYKELKQEEIEAFETATASIQKNIVLKPLVEYVVVGGRNHSLPYNIKGNWKILCPCCKRTLMERITTDDESYPIIYNMTGICKCGQRVDTEWGSVDNLKGVTS